MNFKTLFILLSACLISACGNVRNEAESAEAETHEEPKFQYTSYSDDFEVFAEADPFIIGDTANILSHFSVLPGFKALEKGKVSVVLTVNGKETSQTLEVPTRKGIYSFDIKPETPGNGSLKFEVTTEKGSFELIISGISVFDSLEEAHEAAEKSEITSANSTVFTKEQSWKIDFSTAHPEKGPFGQVIKSTALIQPAPDDEIVITAKASGIVSLSSARLVAGTSIAAKQVLFTISGNEMADNNFSVRYAEAKNDYEKAKADYERAKELAADKIVSEKDLLTARNQYENSKVVYDNLSQNFNASGQNVTSPVSGFINQVFVKNGSFVEAGRPVLTVTQNKTFIMTAEVPQRFLPVLGSIRSANFRVLNESHIYSLEELNGKVLSYGKAANPDNLLIPVVFQFENNGSFTSGSFVEVYIRTVTNPSAVTIPNTSFIEEQGTYFVFVQVTPELFEKREVIPGASDGIRSEVLKGISDNDRIVTMGATIIRLSQATGTLDAHAGHVH